MPIAKQSLWWSLAILVLAAKTHGQSSDRVRHGEETTEGRILRTSAFDITILVEGESVTIPVPEILSVQYGEEPSPLAAARSHVAAGRFEQASRALRRVDREGIERQQIVQDLDYYLAYCQVQMALAGQGNLQTAGRPLYDFLRREGSRDSYHYLEGCRTLGDVFFALGKFDQAESFYRQLESAPWPQARAAAALGTGNALQARDAHAAAIQQFAALDQLDLDDTQRLLGALGKAVSLAHEPTTSDQALQTVQDIIAEVPADADEVLARAYLALGKIHLQRNETKPALFALLSVHLLYPVDPDGHAEALAGLVNVWSAVGHGDRSAEATALLRQRYPSSRHAR